MIILISGKAEAGKTTLAKMIKNELGSPKTPVYNLSFGSAVKYIAGQLGWDGKKDLKGRNLLQLLGDGVRAYNSGFWVKRMMVKIDQIYGQHKEEGIEPIIIIDDARYINEITLLQELYPSVYKIRIRRAGHESKLNEEQRKHPSETELDGHLDMFDQFIFNDGTLEELQEVAKSLAKDVVA